MTVLDRLMQRLETKGIPFKPLRHAPVYTSEEAARVRRSESIRSLRFASREEVAALTQLQPGSIPPFGSLFNLPTWCDDRLAEQATINFNAGDHSVSMSMSYIDYAAEEQPKVGEFAES